MQPQTDFLTCSSQDGLIKSDFGEECQTSDAYGHEIDFIDAD